MENDVMQQMSRLNIEDGGRSLIDLTDPRLGKSGFDLEGYELSKVFDDIVLVQLIDTDETGLIKKGELYVSSSKTVKTWRKGKVLLIGKNVTQCNPGDIVIFPNDNGIQVSNINVKNQGFIYRGIFIAENRIFGVCESTQ